MNEHEAVVRGMSGPIIVMNHINKRFGQLQALDDVSLDVNRGEVMMIIGPSGSGKSTLLRCMNRLETPDSGHILVNGVDLMQRGVNLNSVRKEVGMVFQRFELFPHLTVLQNLTLAQRLVLHRNAREANTIAMELLQKVGIPEKAPSYPTQLSGGQQQRVAIARALAIRPKLILADEPTGDLDTKTGEQVLGLLRALVDNEGVTLMMATHDPAAAEFATDLYQLRDGQIAAREQRSATIAG